MMALVSAIFVALLALVVANDLHRRKATLGAVVARRDRAPRTYWVLIGVWTVCLLASFGILVDVLAHQTECLPVTDCSVILQGAI